MADPKDREPDPYGIGMKADGTVNTLTPEQYQKALLDRQAYEDETEPEEVEDFADLDDDLEGIEDTDVEER